MIHSVILQQLTRWCVYAALAAPLLVNKSLFFPFITGKAIFFRTSVEFAVVAFLCALIFGEIKWREIAARLYHPIILSVLVFGAIFVLTTFTAINPSFAFWSNFERGEGGWQMIHYILFFLLTVLLFSSEHDWLTLLRWHGVVATLVALYAFGQTLNIPGITQSGGQPAGTLGNPLYLGGYLLFTIFLLWWVIARTQNPTAKAIWILLAVFQIVAFFLARGRASIMALGAGIIIILIIGVWQRTHRLITRAATICAGLIIISAAGFTGTILKGDFITAIQPRLWTWSSTIAGIIEKPFFGWGAENFPLLFDKYYNANHYRIETWFDRAHSIFFDNAAAGGIFLLAAYLGLFCTLYYSLNRMKGDRWMPLFVALPSMYLVNGITVFEILPLYLMLFLMLAFSVAYTSGFGMLTTSGFATKPNDIACRKFSALSPIARATAVCAACAIIILAAGSLYATAYLPLRKNKLLITALQANNKIDEQVFAEYEAALTFKSPVGQFEAAQNLFAFTASYFEFLEKTNALKEVPSDKIARLMAINDRWYQATSDNNIGLKNTYLYITTLLKAAEITHNNSYIAAAKSLVENGRNSAPTRIEFIIFALRIADAENNSEERARLIVTGKRIRPNLPWETF